MKNKTLLFLFSIHGLFWIIVGILFAIMRHSYIIPTFMILNAFVLFIFAWNSIKKIKIIYYFSCFYILLNLVLSITDEFGTLDLIVLIINLITIIFLYLSKKEFNK